MDPQFISDLFAPFGPVAVRRMFGGAGLYRDGLMFALEFDGVIFLRVDEASIPDFEREGSRPFVYTRAKRLYDDPEELAVWAERALAIARQKKAAPRQRAKAKQPSKAPKQPKRRAQRRS